MAIKFFFHDTKIVLNNRKKLKRFLQSLFLAEAVPLESLSYIFCTDDYLLSINSQFLGHNYYTDIISFALSEPGLPINGEIYISTERVKDNAGGLKVSMSQELHRVIMHGALHLCGFKDQSAAEKKIMRGLEDKYLQLYMG